MIIEQTAVSLHVIECKVQLINQIYNLTISLYRPEAYVHITNYIYMNIQPIIFLSMPTFMYMYWLCYVHSSIADKR